MATSEPLLSRLPLFPLQAVLYPDGLLRLRIFEVRYLDMIGRCHKAGTPFGVVGLTAGNEVRRPSGAAPLASADSFAPETFYPIGTLARITEFDRPQPGLMMIRCTGAERFRIQSSEKLPHGLWVADVELLPPDSAVPVPEDLASASLTLRQVVDSLQARAEDASQMPLLPPYRFDDCGWVANRWCELLPLEAAQKHRLMTLDNPLVRLELVADTLDRLDVRVPPPGSDD